MNMKSILEGTSITPRPPQAVSDNVRLFASRWGELLGPDDELLRTVGEALRDIDVVVGRANVDGLHGPRFAVASGLVHLYAAGLKS